MYKMIIEKLKQDKLQAMKDKNVILRDLIWIVLTNIQVKEKEKSNVELSEKDYVKIIEKEMKQIEDTMKIAKEKGLPLNIVNKLLRS